MTERQLLMIKRRIRDAGVVLISLLKEHGLKITTAESCTGGMVAQAITAIPGASEVFELSVVTYSNTQKKTMLGVAETTLADHGAVSAETVREMAAGANRLAQSDVSIAISGIAGPGGGTPEKPVGTVWICVCTEKAKSVSKGNMEITFPMYKTVTAKATRFGFPGTRSEVRLQACCKALELAIEQITEIF